MPQTILVFILQSMNLESLQNISIWKELDDIGLILPWRNRGSSLSGATELSQKWGSTLSRRSRIEPGSRGSNSATSQRLFRSEHDRFEWVCNYFFTGFVWTLLRSHNFFYRISWNFEIILFILTLGISNKSTNSSSLKTFQIFFYILYFYLYYI